MKADFTMKIKIYHIVLSLILCIFLYACNEDSLGIEDNVKITILDTADKIHPENIKMTDYHVTVTEYADYQDSGKNNEYGPWSENSIIELKAELDTTRDISHIWLELEIENQGFQNIPGRDIVYKSFIMRADSMMASGSHKLNGTYSEPPWSTLTAVNLDSSQYHVYHGPESPAFIEFREYNRNSRQISIEAYITAEEEYPAYSGLKLKLEARLDIYFSFL